MNVRIYRLGKTATQSGVFGSDRWVLECLSNSRHEPEPLMGWTSAGDTLAQIRLPFKNKDDAVAFAKEKGWSFTVLKEHDKRVRPRNYGDNFRYIPAED